MDDVIHELGTIVDRARESESRPGYFAALHRGDTLEVRDWIRQDRFENGERMDHLLDLGIAAARTAPGEELDALGRRIRHRAPGWAALRA